MNPPPKLSTTQIKFWGAAAAGTSEFSNRRPSFIDQRQAQDDMVSVVSVARRNASVETVVQTG